MTIYPYPKKMPYVLGAELYWIREALVVKWNDNFKMLQHNCLNYYFILNTVKH